MRSALLLLASSAACASPTGAVYSYRQGPAQVTPLRPERPRYAYVPGDAGAVRLPAARIDVRIDDARTGDAAARTLVVPRDEVSRRATARWSMLATGEGAPLALEGKVTRLSSTREGSARRYEASVLFRLLDASGAILFENDESARVEVLDPPYDAAELDELRAGVLLESVDQFLANESLLRLIALRLSSPHP